MIPSKSPLQISRKCPDLPYQGGDAKNTLMKSRFSQINDKRFYFADEITSLLLSHPHLERLIDFKTKKGKRIKRYFWEEKET